MMEQGRPGLARLLEKVIAFGLPIYSFVLVLAFYFKTYDSCQIKITLLHLGGTAFITLWLIKIIEEGRLFSFWNGYARPLLPILLFLISGIVSYLISPFKSASIDEVIKRVLYIGIFFVVAFEFGKGRHVERFFWWIILACLVTSLYGTAQWLGIDPFLWKQIFGRRVFSTFGNPNFFAAFLVLSIPIIIIQLLIKRQIRYILVLLLAVFCLIKTQSKASWIGCCAGFFVFSILSVNFLGNEKRRNIRHLLAGLTIIIALVASTLGVYYFSTKRMDSIRFRLFTWGSTVDMVRRPIYVSPLQSQLLGTGIGTFKIVYPAYRRPEVLSIERRHDVETEHPESEFLELWYDEGIIGIAVFLWIIFAFYWFAFGRLKTMTKEKTKMRYYMVGVIAGLTGLLVHNSMGVNLRFVSSGLFFWILLGLIVAIARGVQEQPSISTGAGQGQLSTEWTVLQTVLAVIGLVVCLNLGRFFIADIHQSRAVAFSKGKLWDKAVKEYNMVLRYNPNYIMAYYFLANVFYDRWNMEKHYEPLWGQDTKIARTDAERALTTYEKVRELAPHYVQLHHKIGLVYMKLGLWKTALQHFNEYRKIDPLFSNNYLQMAQAYVKLGELDKAAQIYKPAIVKFPRFEKAYLDLAYVYYEKGDRSKAEEMYLNVLEANPRSLVACQYLVNIYLKELKVDSAIEICRKILEIDPTNKDIKQLLSELQP